MGLWKIEIRRPDSVTSVQPRLVIETLDVCVLPVQKNVMKDTLDDPPPKLKGK